MRPVSASARLLLPARKSSIRHAAIGERAIVEPESDGQGGEDDARPVTCVGEDLPGSVRRKMSGTGVSVVHGFGKCRVILDVNARKIHKYTCGSFMNIGFKTRIVVYMLSIWKSVIRECVATLD